MKKMLLGIFIILLFGVPAQAGNAKKVLIIASNVADMGDPEKHEARNDLWEYAPPYHVFVSPNSGNFSNMVGGEINTLVGEFFDFVGRSSHIIKIITNKPSTIQAVFFVLFPAISPLF